MNKVNVTLVLSVLVYVLNSLRFYLFPLISTDSTWTLSSLYDYLRDSSLKTSSYAHEYLGPIFDFNTLHLFLSPVFNVFELNTTNFIVFHFIIILITGGLLWYLISNKLFASLAILFYVSDGYTYGMRSESYTVLLALLFLLSWFKIKYIPVRRIISILLILFICFMHPIGGLLIGITFIFLVYIELLKSGEIINQSKKDFLISFGKELLKITLLTGIVLLAFGIDKVMNLALAYITPSNDTGNHFDGLHFELLTKYLFLGNVFSFYFLLIFSFKFRQNFWLAYFFLFTLILLVSGRSYYFSYFLIPLVIILSGDLPFLEALNNALLLKYTRKLTAFFVMYVFALNSLKLVSSAKAYNAGITYKNVLKEISHLKHQNKKDLVFLPSELSIEFHKNENQRIIFPSLRVIYKKEVDLGTLVYFFSTEQTTWIEKNESIFGNSNDWKYDTIIPFVPGQYSLIGSIMSAKPVNNIGLLKLTRIK